MINDRIAVSALWLQLNDNNEGKHVNKVVQFCLKDIFANFHNLLHLWVDPRRCYQKFPFIDGLVFLTLDTDPKRIVKLIKLRHQMINGCSVIDNVGLFFQKLIVIVLERENAVGFVIRTSDNFQKLALMLDQRLLKWVTNWGQLWKLLCDGLSVRFF